jgi:DNA primase
MKSAIAEETLLSLILREPALLEQTKSLRAEQFSSPLLANVYRQLSQRYSQGMEVSVAVLADLSGEEMSHIAGILQRHTGPVSEDALSDCIRTIQAEQQLRTASSEDDLLRIREKLKERKGIRT